MRSHQFRKIMAVLIIGFFFMQLIPAKSVSAAVDLTPYYNDIGKKIEVMANKYNIPPVLLKAIAWMESGWKQYKLDPTTGQPLTDQPLMGVDGIGIGIMQISSYDPNDKVTVDRLKNDINYNLEVGCQILNQKWRAYPKIGNGDRNILENWYFAVWGYNNWGSRNNPNVLTGKSAYQDSIFSLIGQKYNSAITFAPGATKLSQSLLPPVNPPSLASFWSTPTPTHMGDLVIDQSSLISTGGGPGVDAANGDYWYNYARWGSYYALGFYITAYNSPLVTDKTIVSQKILNSYKNLLAEADALALEGIDSSTATAAKYYWTVLQGTSLDAGIAERARAGYQKTKVSNITPIFRLGGLDQYETAAKIADQGWTSTSDNAILAPGLSANMVDALAAGPLAAKFNAPILLTEGGKLNPFAKAELIRLKVKTVYVVSGTAVIKQSVLDDLKTLPNAVNVVALGGTTQYDTAVNIAKNMGAFTKIAVATGDQNITPADALSVASIAGAQGMPIILTEKGALPVNVKTFLDSVKATITESDIIGGTGVVADTVKTQLPGAVNRYCGNTAYDTNVAVLKAFDGVLKYDHVFVANGETAIDALAGAPLAAMYNAGIVLTNKTTNEGTSYVRSKASSSSIVTALGGISVVPDSVLNGTVYQPL